MASFPATTSNPTGASSASVSAVAAAPVLLDLGTDERADPRLVAMLTPLQCARRMPNPRIDHATASLDDRRGYCRMVEQGIQMVLNMINPAPIPRDNVVHHTVVIKGMDNNDITLHIHSPTTKAGSVPCVYHIHGGGMAYLRATDVGYMNWRSSIAARGAICIGVEFRNSAGELGPHPFPAGLNDCHSGLQWVHEQRQALGISKIVVSGESGGANLTFALSIKCKREGSVDMIDGIFVQCPFISGMYGCSEEERQATYPSLVEFDGYVLTCKGMAITASVYTPEDREAFRTNPLAWPHVVSIDELRGMPPHQIVVNELDPLRDEGRAYHRKLMTAGVDSACVTLHGLTHAAELTYFNTLPNYNRLCLDQLDCFARSI